MRELQFEADSDGVERDIKEPTLLNSNNNLADNSSNAEIKGQLQECLDHVKHKGTYTTFRHFKHHPNPGLHVEGLGTIGLPLSDRDAKVIAALARKSPFGRGDETIVDESVRKTWELEASEITCRNPAWSSFKDKMADQIFADIGVQVPAVAQAYKLLLYEEGAFFKAHRDTEKAPGMFGTMVVCLPSEHTGGEVHLLHGHKKAILRTADTSAHDLSVLAWYSDVQHEIKSVLSGHRLVLTYNLLQDQKAPKQTAAALDPSREELERLLDAWNRDYSSLEYLAYPLSFKYTEESLASKNLKGDDAAKGRCLDYACVKAGFYWYMCQMTKSTQEYDEDFLEYSFGVTNLSSGHRLDLKLGAVEPDLVLANLDELYGASRYPDSEEEEEFTGNDAAGPTYRYHNTVVILIKKEQLLKRFRSRKMSTTGTPAAYFDLICRDTACDPDLRRNALMAILEELVALNTEQDDDVRDEQHDSVSDDEEAEEMKDAENAEGLERVANYCGQNGLDTFMRRLFRSATEAGTWTSSTMLIDLIARYVASDYSSGKLNAWDDWFSTPLPTKCTYNYVSEQWLAYEKVRTVLPSSARASFHEWRATRIEAAIRAVKSYSEEAVSSILSLITVISPALFFESILPTLVGSLNAVGLSRFLSSLPKEKAVSREVIVIPTYKHLASMVGVWLELSLETITASPSQPYHPSSESNLPGEFLAIIEWYLSLHLTSEATTILAAGLPDIPVPTSTLWKQWKQSFRFLESLATLLLHHTSTEPREPFHNFTLSLLHTAAAHLASTHPQAPHTWTQPSSTKYGPTTCSCEPCIALQRFLVSPSARIGQFCYDGLTCIHLQQRVNRADFDIQMDGQFNSRTLVITKTRNRYDRKLREWQDAVSDMRAELAALDNVLERLGINATAAARLDEQLGSVLARGHTLVDQRSQLGPMSPQHTATTGQVAGVKRKSDFINE